MKTSSTINRDLRMVRMTTPHGDFVGFSFVMFDKSERIIDLEPVPNYMADEEELIDIAHQILLAIEMPIIDVQGRFVIRH